MSRPKRMVATLGAFDGVHRGHHALLSQVARRATDLGLPSVCVTLHPHPDVVLYPDRQVTYLTGLAEKEALIKQLGITEVLVIEFTRELSMLRADEFLDLLQRKAKLAELWLGPDTAFGRGREGTVARVAEIGRERGFSVHLVPPLRLDHEVVSSTSIRNLLRLGEVPKAAELLGRAYVLEGQVVMGASRGRQLGFPTANVQVPADRTLPGDGVYVATAVWDHERRPAAVNLGPRPTFGEAERLLEVHVLDFEGDLYGCQMCVEFQACVRAVRKFASLEELRAQIAQDVATTRRLWRPTSKRG